MIVFERQFLKTKMICQCCDLINIRRGDKVAKQIHGKVSSHFEVFSYSLTLFDTVIFYCLAGSH